MPVFILLLFLGVAVLWLLLSFCFIPIGKFVSRLIKDAKTSMSKDDFQELELANIEAQTAKVQAEKDKEVAQIAAEKAIIEAEAKAEATRIAAEAEVEW